MLDVSGPARADCLGLPGSGIIVDALLDVLPGGAGIGHLGRYERRFQGCFALGGPNLFEIAADIRAWLGWLFAEGEE